MQSFLSSVSVPYWCTNNNGDVWFCLKDVCNILELTQPSKVKERLNQKGVLIIPTLIKRMGHLKRNIFN